MSKNVSDTKPQIERFREKARELGCDEDEAAFDEKLRQIAQYKPPAKAPKTPRPPKSSAGLR